VQVTASTDSTGIGNESKLVVAGCNGAEVGAPKPRRIMVTKNIIEDDEQLRVAAAGDGRRKLPAKLRPLLSTIDENVEVQHAEGLVSDGKRQRLDELKTTVKKTTSTSTTSAAETHMKDMQKASDDSFDELRNYVELHAAGQSATSCGDENLHQEKSLKDSCAVQTPNSSDRVEKSGKNPAGDEEDKRSGSERSLTVDEVDAGQTLTQQDQQTDAKNDEVRSDRRDDVDGMVDDSSELTACKGEMSQTPTGSGRCACALTPTCVTADDEKMTVAELEGGSRASPPAKSETESRETSGISQTSFVVSGEAESTLADGTNDDVNTGELEHEEDSSVSGTTARNNNNRTRSSARRDVIASARDHDVMMTYRTDESRTRRQRRVASNKFVVPVKRRDFVEHK